MISWVQRCELPLTVFGQRIKGRSNPHQNYIGKTEVNDAKFLGNRNRR